MRGEWFGRRQEKVWGDALQMIAVFKGSHLRGQDYCGINGNRFYVVFFDSYRGNKMTGILSYGIWGVKEKKKLKNGN